MPNRNESNPSNTDNKVDVRNLTKIFGADPQAALDQLERGADKDKIFEKTGNVVAVSNVSFSVEPGQIFVVMGLSGSGKSTLIRCVNRLIAPTSGQVRIDGEDIVEVDDARLREIRLNKVAMVFQHFALFPHRTVVDNVAFGLKIRGLPAEERREKAIEALDRVGLKSWADSAPDTLSGGMKQRVGLARALAADAEILLMDEPFSALDPLIRRDMQQELIQLQQRLRMTIIFITHDLHEALTIGDQIAIMKDGRFVQVGSPEEIVAAPADPYVASFTQDVDRSRVISAQRIMHPAETISEAVLSGSDKPGPSASGDGALFVTDQGDRPVGLLLARDVDPTTPATIPIEAMRRDFPRADADAKLCELFDACAQGLPIAVLQQDRLIGVLDPRDVFVELAREDGGASKTTGTASEHAREPAALEASHG
jgi:glycine betaine/proline transport system ATP-binding protein